MDIVHIPLKLAGDLSLISLETGTGLVSYLQAGELYKHLDSNGDIYDAKVFCMLMKICC